MRKNNKKGIFTPQKDFKVLTHQPPGTLKYTGGQKAQKTVIEVIEYDSTEYKRSVMTSVGELPQVGDKVIWLNVIGMHDTNLITEIGKRFDIHRVDMEGVVNVLERSKIEEKESYLYSLLKMVYIIDALVVHEHIAIILNGNCVITFQEHEGDVFDAVRERLEKAEGQIRTLGADYLYTSLTDNVIDQYYTVLNYISDRFSEAENDIILENKNDTKKVYWLRKELLYLKNSLEPVQQSLKSFVHNTPHHISQGTLPYLRDVLDNVNQIMDEIMGFREMVNGLYETQMSNAGNDMNRIMMTLTIFSAIFIPLSFLAGVFGMNFSSLPGIASPSSFIYFCLGCVSIAVVMLIFFKRRKWF